MSEQLPDKTCQIQFVPEMKESDWFGEHFGWIPRRVVRFINRRLRFIQSFFMKTNRPGQSELVSVLPTEALQAGDWVEVKSRQEIQLTLDHWNHLRGCGFLEEMAVYCGTRHKILKRVERFLDERDYKIKKSRGIVILEGVNCQGSADFGRCDRNCSFFWREEWLKKITEDQIGD